MDRPMLNSSTNRGKRIKIVKVRITDIVGNVFEYSSVKEAAIALQTSENYLRVCEQKFKKFRGAALEFIREIVK